MCKDYEKIMTWLLCKHSTLSFNKHWKYSKNWMWQHSSRYYLCAVLIGFFLFITSRAVATFTFIYMHASLYTCLTFVWGETCGHTICPADCIQPSGQQNPIAVQSWRGVCPPACACVRMWTPVGKARVIKVMQWRLICLHPPRQNASTIFVCCCTYSTYILYFLC